MAPRGGAGPPTAAHGLSGYLANAGENLKTFARTWSRMAGDFGRTAQPSASAPEGLVGGAPVPVVGLELDEVLGGLDLRVPLDRRIWKRVRLVAIE